MSSTPWTDRIHSRDLLLCSRQVAASFPLGGGVSSYSSPLAFSTLWKGFFIPAATPAHGRGWHLLLFILLAWLPAMAAAELKPFQPDSLQAITSAREGRPFLLLLWSLDCPPCMKELAGLRQQLKDSDAQHLVLVSTDGPGQQVAVEHALRGFGLEQFDNWLFADDFSERLRFHIDPNWFGELPRAYFYAADHSRRAKSGVLKAGQLQRWLQQRQAGDN